jgi:hypothetical protein
MTSEQMAMLANIQWRATEGQKTLEELMAIIDAHTNDMSEEECDKAINLYTDLREAWLEGINMVSKRMLEES